MKTLSIAASIAACMLIFSVVGHAAPAAPGTEAGDLSPDGYIGRLGVELGFNSTGQKASRTISGAYGTDTDTTVIEQTLNFSNFSFELIYPFSNKITLLGGGSFSMTGVGRGNSATTGSYFVGQSTNSFSSNDNLYNLSVRVRFYL